MLSDGEIRLNKESILELLGSVDRSGIESLIDWYTRSDFFEAPASTRFHGNFRGGLAAHSLGVYRVFDKKLNEYGINMKTDSRIISALGHDSCKIDFYFPNFLSNGKRSPDKPYKVNDLFPFGHGEKSAYLLQKHINLTPQEALVVRWHMGSFDSGYEFVQDNLEKIHPEIVLFHHADKEVSLLGDA